MVNKMQEKDNLNLTNQLQEEQTESSQTEQNSVSYQVQVQIEDGLQLPLLAMKGLILFPNVSTSFDVGREKSLNAVHFASDNGGLIFISAQRSRAIEDPAPEDLYSVGVVCKIKRITHLTDRLRVFVEGLYRARATEFISTEPHFSVKVERMPAVYEEGVDIPVCLDMLKSEYREHLGKTEASSEEKVFQIEDADVFVNVVTFRMDINENEKQAILQNVMVLERAEALLAALRGLKEIRDAEKRISERVRKNVEKGQKEYYLREQLRAIHQELGDDENEKDEFEKRIKEKNMPKEIEEKALKELFRMSKMNPSSPDYTVLRTYLDWILELPFSEKTVDRESIKDAKEILDADHFGLEKVKGRIVEYLAVMKLTKKISGSILCLVGPPGVGKTSVASSIARALDRKFVRMSLGGVKDEAEIRGHRKTYIGAMPGRIMYGLKSAGSANPVFLLDEIDKLSSDLRGDPASALLEVLDPEQNVTFRDRYLEIPYDLSDVLFITTANSLHTIPAPLLDRMEVIELNGYTQEEKIQIAKRYLVPKKLKENGVETSRVKFSESGIKEIVEGYTREAGVRNLEREIGSVCRKIACDIAENGGKRKYVVSEENVEKYLGAKKYLGDDQSLENDVGSATGLAWTAVGGTTLSIEVCLMSGKGEILLTGKLGDVMKESARTAISYIRAHAVDLGIDPNLFSTRDIHIHVPEGATPKDGPSAGITIATAICSAFTEKMVNKRIAMTGEITLRGKVLPIGGLKDKALAGFRLGIRDIIIPVANVKDLEEIPSDIRSEINFIPVSDVSEVFKHAIIGLKK